MENLLSYNGSFYNTVLEICFFFFTGKNGEFHQKLFLGGQNQGIDINSRFSYSDNA